MERIILGYDGSPASVSALAWVAARSGQRPEAKVGVVNVASRFTRDRVRGLEQLSDAEAFLQSQAPGVSVELHRLEGGVPDSLTEFAVDADLLVVGINVGHPMRAVMTGAVPLRLTARAQAPVVLVPTGWVDTADPVTVGIADDDSSDSALEFAASEALESDVPLRLIHAWLMPTPSVSGSAALSDTSAQVRAEHEATLDTAAARAAHRYPGLDVRSELVRDSRGSALLRHAARSSMLVIGTHGRGLLTGRLRGSVAQALLWHADCPVVVVPRGTLRHDG